jgi:hypothetical protein
MSRNVMSAFSSRESRATTQCAFIVPLPDLSKTLQTLSVAARLGLQ